MNLLWQFDDFSHPWDEISLNRLLQWVWNPHYYTQTFNRKITSISHFHFLFQVGWRITGEWIAGNIACKILLFLRAFGPYLSSNVLVCVSLDRYFAVLHPLRVSDARRRGKSMLAVAWMASFVYCIPQVSLWMEGVLFCECW